MFQDFLAQGLCVIPLHNGKPQVEWSRFYDALPSIDEARRWDEAGHTEYALLCGKMSGVIALDIDTDDTALIYTLAGPTPLRKRGSKGFTAFYRYNGERSGAWGGVVEILSDKRLTTIPPSPHRKTGIPYEWLDGNDFNDLPIINPDLLTFLDAKYPRKTYQAAPKIDYSDQSVDLSDASEMLDYISSDCGRDEWIEIGMALRHEFGDAACHLWHAWSQKAGKRYNHNDAQAAWRSFSGEGVTIGTLIYHAKQGGYVLYESPAEEDYAEIDLYISHLIKKPEKKQLRVGGLVGEIADWITETAPRPQPILSLAAALSFVSMLKGHRYAGTTNRRTNLLIMALAPSAAGKEHPQNCITRLAFTCGLEGKLMGEPTSGTGFLRALNDRRCALWVMDEIGRYLENISLKNAGGYQREVKDYIITSFSKADSVLKGKEYADNKKNPTIDIIQPHFCCLGSTVTDRLKAACTSNDIVDGFLNRWIVLAAPDRSVRAKEIKITPPPQRIVNQILALDEVQYSPYDSTPCEMQTIRFSPEAWDVFAAYMDDLEAKIDAADYKTAPLYARCGEHVEKIAMTLCEGNMIHLSDLRAAIDIVDYSNSCIAEFAGLIADNDHERDKIRVREVIYKHKRITRNELTRKTQSIKNIKTREEILNDLIEGGFIGVEKIEDSSTRRAKHIFYAINQ